MTKNISRFFEIFRAPGKWVNEIILQIVLILKPDEFNGHCGYFWIYLRFRFYTAASLSLFPFSENAIASEQMESNLRTHLVFMCFAAENINHSYAVLRFHMFSISRRSGSSEKLEGDIILFAPGYMRLFPRKFPPYVFFIKNRDQIKNGIRQNRRFLRISLQTHE